MTLPEPDAIGRAHGARLAALIEARIAEGPLPFVDYMALALYAPGLGYYMAGAPKFGAEGDFVTAPELSPLFGRALAAQCRDVLDALEAVGGGQGSGQGSGQCSGQDDGESGGERGGPGGGGVARDGGPGGEPGAGERGPSSGVLELGAGSGRLAASLVAAFGERPLDYTILEPSAELRRRQRALLGQALAPAAFARVRWIETLPPRFDGVILANEVMDALPVERFVRWRERTLQVCVERGEGARFVDATRPAPAALAEAVAAIEADTGRVLPHGYTSELCPTLGPWVASLADTLGRGIVLLADYGYPRGELYLPERASGTLACYYLPPPHPRRSLLLARTAGHHRARRLHRRGRGGHARLDGAARLRDAVGVPARLRARRARRARARAARRRARAHRSGTRGAHADPAGRDGGAVPVRRLRQGL